ncbi:nodal homolog [Lytechinus variegatus]|uniref:nodal homolog n=1 Tax=Lytechinus variegatus TaxID=7654 RepID=UPI001BB0E5D2|nr:nodal homolog [Lytechinus variegatus]
MHLSSHLHLAAIVCICITSSSAFFAPFLHETASALTDDVVTSTRTRRNTLPLSTPDVLDHGLANGIQHVDKNSSTMFMVELFESLYTGHNLVNPSKEECRAIEEADTVRSYIGVVEDVRSSSDLAMTWQTSFPTFDHPIDEAVHLAELRVRLNTTFDHPSRRFVIQLHQWVNVSCDEDLCQQRKLIHSRNIDARHDDFDGREVFDITKVVHQWIAMTNDATSPVEYSIELRAKPIVEQAADHDMEVLKALIAADIHEYVDIEVDSNDVPIFGDVDSSTSPLTVNDVTLVVFSRAPSSPIILSDAYNSVRARTRRSTDEARRRKKEKEQRKHQRDEHKQRLADKLRQERERSGPCRRVDMDVDFGRIGWDEWIIYPKQFNAYRCVGTCAGPLDSGDNPSNHAIMQDLIRLKQPERRTPEPCCIPTKLKPLSMLYFEEGSVLVRHHEDMIVQECGCR